MAEEEKQEQESAPEIKKRPMKLIIIAVAAVVVLGAGGVAAYLMLGGDHAEASTDGEAARGQTAHSGPQEIGPVTELDSFIVNLVDQDSNRYLKLTAHLEVASETIAEEVEKRNPQIRDAIITLLGSKAIGDVSDVKGKFKLRREMIMRLNDILGEGAVSQVYFTEFIVQ